VAGHGVDGSQGRNITIAQRQKRQHECNCAQGTHHRRVDSTRSVGKKGKGAVDASMTCQAGTDPERRAVCKVEHKICALCVIERELLQDNTGVVSYPDQSGPRCRRVFDAVMAFFRSSGPAADPSTARMPHILSLLSQGFWRGFVRGADESMIQEVAKFAY
jgi:hypothetical protein